MLKEFILNCVITVQAGVNNTSQLILEYSVQNQGSETVALFNRIHKGFDNKGKPIVDTNFVGVVLHENEIVISKKLFPIPPGTLVETPYLPYLTKIAPAARFEERVVLNLPLVTWDPYLGIGKSALPSLGKSLPIYFELGMFTLARQSAIGTTETTLGPLLSVQAFTESAQRVARFGPLPVSINVGPR